MILISLSFGCSLIMKFNRWLREQELRKRHKLLARPLLLYQLARLDTTLDQSWFALIHGRASGHFLESSSKQVVSRKMWQKWQSFLLKSNPTLSVILMSIHCVGFFFMSCHLSLLLNCNVTAGRCLFFFRLWTSKSFMGRSGGEHGLFERMRKVNKRISFFLLKFFGVKKKEDNLTKFWIWTSSRNDFRSCWQMRSWCTDHAKRHCSGGESNWVDLTLDQIETYLSATAQGL